MHDCCLPHDHGGVFEHGLEKMPTMEAFSLAADVFKQLDDPSRLKIFWLLCHDEECVINLSSLMDMSSPAVSHHLNKLRSSGLIVRRKQGLGKPALITLNYPADAKLIAKEETNAVSYTHLTLPTICSV